MKRFFLTAVGILLLTACSDGSTPESSTDMTTVPTQTTVTTEASSTTASTSQIVTTTATQTQSSVEVTTTAAAKAAIFPEELGLDILSDTQNTITLDKHSDGYDFSEQIETWVYPRLADMFYQEGEIYSSVPTTVFHRFCDIPEQYQEQYTLTVTKDSKEIYRLTVISDAETEASSKAGYDDFKVLITDRQKSDTRTVCCLCGINATRIHFTELWKLLVPVAEEDPEKVEYNESFLHEVLETYTFSKIESCQNAEAPRRIPEEELENCYQLLKSYFTEHDPESLEYDYFNRFWIQEESEKFVSVRIYLTRPQEGKIPLTVSEPYEIRISYNQRYAAIMYGDTFTAFRLEDTDALRPVFELLSESLE